MVNKRWWLPWVIAAVSIAAILLICLALAAHAAPSYQSAEQVPGIVSYQGQVDINGVPFSGTGYFRFAIIDSGETFYWSNDGSVVTPTVAVTLSVVGGLFNALLGETNPITYGMLLDSDRWLRVWFDDGTHGIQLLEPDTRITSALFAFRADESMTAITSTYATTATWSFGSITATIATTANYALWANISNYATVADEATDAWALLDSPTEHRWFPQNFARIAGNSFGSFPKSDMVQPYQVTYWEPVGVLTIFTHTSVLTSSPNLVFDGSTMTATNVVVSGAFSATVVTATYATEALTATQVPSSAYANNTALGSRVYAYVVLTVPTVTHYMVPFDSELFDTDSIHSAGTETMTCNTAGIYVINGSVRFNAVLTGTRMVGIWINGAIVASQRIQALTPASAGLINISTIWMLNKGDTVTLRAWQDSGISVQVAPSGAQSAADFAMVRIP